MAIKAEAPAVCETDDFPAQPKSRQALRSTVCETDDGAHLQPKHINRQSLEYVLKSGLAGGIAGCAAKTLIAPLDRVKILFQTSNPQFSRYSGQWLGVWHATRDIHQQFGVTGLFKGHAATLLRIFPYAAIKFVAYEQFRAIIIPNESDEVPWKRFTAGSLAGMTSVFFTYPLEVIRVRLAFETKQRRIGIRAMCKEMYNERSLASQSPSTSTSTHTSTLASSKSTTTPQLSSGLKNFYRGFSPTLAGMLPYAGVSFLTHDWISDLLRDRRISKYTMTRDAQLGETRQTRPPLFVWAELTAGGLAGMMSQTASYPLEVVRRRMQVSGAVGTGQNFGFVETTRTIWRASGVKGFYVGLTIGYIKVIPMVACSFYVYERMKLYLGIN